MGEGWLGGGAQVWLAVLLNIDVGFPSLNLSGDLSVSFFLYCFLNSVFLFVLFLWSKQVT